MKTFTHLLQHNILAYWTDRMQDHTRGGFYGRIDGTDTLHPDAPKGGILHARILWTFSAAYRLLKDPTYLHTAERAFHYIRDYFIDKEYGGLYRELHADGTPLQTKKQLYMQGFALYAFSEFYRVTRRPEALALSRELFRLIEAQRDPIYGGYPEAFTREWHPLADMRLSPKDANEPKTMNTHLHLLEAYTNLYRIWPHPQVKEALTTLLQLFTEKIIDKKTHHLHLFFENNWKVKSQTISYGHDIEASWLLYEAAEILQDHSLSPLYLKIASASLEGYQPDGSMLYEKEEDRIDQERHWWVQAETVVGLMYAWTISSDPSFREKALQTWKYILEYMVDKEHGEWY